jgi:hypothetical protein
MSTHFRLCHLRLTHSATSPNACHWGVRAESPKGLNGLSLSVSTLRIPIEDAKYRKQAPMLAIGVFECVDR